MSGMSFPNLALAEDADAGVEALATTVGRRQFRLRRQAAWLLQ
ncbi:hypothetical protein [Azorhizophilus paspali]|uniref:Transposase n=1 Tax=Azorhizophilus paspali TaxID=69963 RepID=A0ABV6SR17_AZOPA